MSESMEGVEASAPNLAPISDDGGPIRIGAITLSNRHPKGLFAAIVAAKKDMLPVPRTAANPAFKRDGEPMRYATLGDIDEAMKKPLEMARLAVVAGSEMNDNIVSVTTLIGHADTGEWAATTLSAKPRDTSPQAVGATITYMRRYGESAILSIVTEDDDDGNAASLPQDRRGGREDRGSRSAPANVVRQKASALKEALQFEEREGTAEEANRLFQAAWRDWLSEAPKATQDHFIEVMKKNFDITPFAAAGDR